MKITPTTISFFMFMAMTCLLAPVKAIALVAPISKLEEASVAPQCINVIGSYVQRPRAGKEFAIEIQNGCEMRVSISRIAVGSAPDKLKEASQLPAMVGTVTSGKFFVVDSLVGVDCEDNLLVPDAKTSGCKSFILDKGDIVTIGIPFNNYYLLTGRQVDPKGQSLKEEVRIQGKISH